MLQFLNTPVGQSVIWTSILVLLAITAYYVVLKFRDRNADDRPGVGDLLANFREMQDQGAISETEFRTIKTKLGPDFQQQVSGRGDKGSNESA